MRALVVIAPGPNVSKSLCMLARTKSSAVLGKRDLQRHAYRIRSRGRAGHCQLYLVHQASISSAPSILEQARTRASIHLTIKEQAHSGRVRAFSALLRPGPSTRTLLRDQPQPPAGMVRESSTLAAHGTQALGRVLLDPGQEAMLQHRRQRALARRSGRQAAGRTMWNEWPHFPFTAASTSQLTVCRRRAQAPVGESTYVARSCRRDICRWDRCHRTARGRCRRRRPRAYPSARSRRHSIP